MKRVIFLAIAVIASSCLTAQMPAEDDAQRYLLQDSVLIKTTYGITLSAIIVRPKDVSIPQPAVLAFTIYADSNNLRQAKTGAAYGYASVLALARGKGLSPDEVVPYEAEVQDVNAVIDWIIQQPWSNGQVGMYGGSYNGFAAWAATKHLHPALKTIVPYVAAIPGQGVPMENNVFINANYGWAFYVSNNKYLDDKVYRDPKRWNTLSRTWYASGVPYRKIDSIDGTPNPWLQRWLQHPAFDKYWQDMIPYGPDFAHINIPVLSITGYYDDGQISALQYVQEHYKYNKNAEHYLIIGPYDHFGAQVGGAPVLREYKVDSVALISTRNITFEWMDYILKNGKKPILLKDKINFEVMGANQWRHAPSLETMSNDTLMLYLTNSRLGNYYQLSAKKPAHRGYLTQTINFADTQTANNTDYYPYPIIKQQLQDSSGLYFITEPFDQPVSVNGTFAGSLIASINKKDMDIGVTFYELMPDGRYFHLSYFLGRASYAKDKTVRQLLTPGEITTIPFDRTRLVSRQLSKGSRLLVVLNINRNPFAQVNYGTGKDVSDESIQDAGAPLQVQWYNDSFIRVPVWK
ncbi:CocE/NonD family hydrolase [Pseudoflavitalea sp. X16]|uniref:CocE/NonD family hydrolase n=1 Tax=Paraflavitalea devenefica TaxID=2716334 RepID=UPI00141E6620|nr:CocE/NonD family hydrolase [Paraflavitalea devenefica]NII27355.1 CocE/NonD family hydrolase [Paraflavitalea devenefica]